MNKLRKCVYIMAATVVWANGANASSGTLASYPSFEASTVLAQRGILGGFGHPKDLIQLLEGIPLIDGSTAQFKGISKDGNTFVLHFVAINKPLLVYIMYFSKAPNANSFSWISYSTYNHTTYANGNGLMVLMYSITNRALVYSTIERGKEERREAKEKMRRQQARELHQPILLTNAAAHPPRYPPEAKRHHESGTVYVSVFVDALGTITKVTVTRSSGYTDLDNAALQSIKRWKFKKGFPGIFKTQLTFKLTNMY